MAVRLSWRSGIGHRCLHHWIVDNPYCGQPIIEQQVFDLSEAQRRVERARQASLRSSCSLKQRIQLIQRFMLKISEQKENISKNITKQMGKPIKQAQAEVQTLLERTRAMMEMASRELADERFAIEDGIQKKIVKEPIGVVMILAPWNYPLLTAGNGIIAAVLAGNAVLVKHSERTPLCADVFADAFKAAGAEENLVQSLHIDHETVAKIVSHPAIGYVQFTGSVQGGQAVYSAVAQSRFIDVGLELGGKDPAYVCADADLNHTVENIVDGAMYNAGQSCCSIERVYVDKNIFTRFVDMATEKIKSYKLGDPMQTDTTMGPLAQPRHPDFVDRQVKQAATLGAKIVVGGFKCSDAANKGRFYSPTLLTECTHNMSVMVDETFGPVLAIAAVDNDEQAIKLMNDSSYGLTASIWTKNTERFERLAQRIDTGTVFMNRADFVDPFLPWSGRKDSGRGYGLSRYGFLPYIRTKAYNARISIPE